MWSYGSIYEFNFIFDFNMKVYDYYSRECVRTPQVIYLNKKFNLTNWLRT